MKPRTLIYFCLAFIAGCRVEQAENTKSKTLQIECAEFEGTTKSECGDDASSALNDVNIFVYDSDGNLVNSPTEGNFRTYFETPKSIPVESVFPDMNGTYSIYAVANIGAIDPSLMRTLSTAENYRFYYESYSGFLESGFPKAAVIQDFTPSTSAMRIRVKRLVTKYNLHIVNDSGYKFELQSVSVCQSARDLCPFSQESRAESSFEMEGDCLTVEEIDACSGSVYVLENVRGEVFPSYSDPKDRTIDNLDEDEKPLCTFLEFSGKLTDTDGGVYETAVYRYYFGEKSFVGVRRNQIVDVDLYLTMTCVRSDGWRTDPGDYKAIFPEKQSLTFSWRGTDTFICPLYSESFSGVQQLSPTGSSRYTMPVSATVGWRVVSSPSWMNVIRQGSSILCQADWLKYGLTSRSGEIVLESSDGVVRKSIPVTQNPSQNWMRFPLKTNCYIDLKSKAADNFTISTYYYSNSRNNEFRISSIYAVTGIRPGVTDLMLNNLTGAISISYGNVTSSGDSSLPYKHPVTIKIPKTTVSQMRDIAGASGCVLYFDMDNVDASLYADPTIAEDPTPTSYSGINSGLPRIVIRLY